MRHSRRTRFNFTAILLEIALICASCDYQFPRQSFAADPAAVVEERLAAGEFGPALLAARAIKDAAARDKLLGQIAGAQAAAGGRPAAIDTAADIANDVDRKAALGSLAASSSQRGGPGRGARGGGAQADFTR